MMKIKKFQNSFTFPKISQSIIMPDCLESGILYCKSSYFCIHRSIIEYKYNQNVVFSTDLEFLFVVQLAILNTQC